MTNTEKARLRAKEHHARNREARNSKARARYAANRQAEIERSRRYSLTPEGQEARRRYQREHRAEGVVRNRKYRQTLYGRAATLVRSAKSNARKCGVSFCISVDDILPLLITALSDGMVTLAAGHHDTASLDRIIPACGYVPGNVQVIPWWLNSAYNRFPKELINEAILKMAERLCYGIHIPTSTRGK
jgi:hypothetical protein